MKGLTAPQSLATALMFTGVLCSVQVALQEPVYDKTQNAFAGCSFQTYAAIGDSYSAGLASGAQLPICNSTVVNNNCTSTVCARNFGAYGYQFARIFRFAPNFLFTACSGATTSQIQAQQVPLIDTNTELVTLTAGGDNNDIFARVILNCVYDPFGNCDQALSNASVTIQNIDQSMVNLWNSIKARAPRATIVHLGYVQFWPANTNFLNCQDGFLASVTPQTRTRMNQLVDTFNDKILTLALRNNVTFFSVNSAFIGHRLCDVVNDPWILWKLGGNSTNYYDGIFHPSWDGQHAYYQGLLRALGC